MDPRWRFTTRAVHGGQIADTHKSVVPPIYQTATFYYDTAEEGARLGQEVPPGFLYTRWANPTTRVFETKVAVLEGAEDALATASGMAAVSTAVVASLRRGDHAVTPSAVYQATYLLFAQILPEFGIETTVISDTSLEAYERALRPNTRLLYIETPNNPVLGITDIAGLVDLARRHGARTIADNTFATPYNQTPLALGVDTVVHSATKYLGGHHDLTAGVIAGPSEFLQRAKRYLQIFGATIDPFGAWLASRGVITLGLRVERQNQSAAALAAHLADHPKVGVVHYPGLPTHPGHTVAARQMRGFTGMLSFDVRGGYDAGVRVFEALKVAKRATSLGGTTTLVSHPASVSSVHMPREVREAAGITDGLIRVSVGIEEAEDIIEDFDQALEQA